MCSFNLCTLLTKTAVTNYMQVVKTYGQDHAKVYMMVNGRL